MMDASVRFMKNSVNYNVYLATGTMAGGEVIDETAF